MTSDGCPYHSHLINYYFFHSLQIEDEQNLVAFQYNENIYYRVIIDIHPGKLSMELENPRLVEVEKLFSSPLIESNFNFLYIL